MIYRSSYGVGMLEDWNNGIMNYPAASYGVSIGSYHYASRGGELVRLRRIKPLPASGGLVRLRRIESK